MKKKLFLSFLIMLFVYASTNLAQTSEQAGPYKEGESLTYEGKFKKFGFAISIAEMNFTVSKLPETGSFHVKTEARSKGTLIKLFNFKFFQEYQSIIDANQLNIRKTIKRDEQGDRLRESEANFDYQKRKVTYTETDPNDASRPPRRVASTIVSDTQDIISAVYSVRGQDLAVGKSYIFKVSDSGLVYDVPIKITARERKKSILGKKWCWRVEPEVFGDGRIIEQRGSLTIWITDDEHRIPIRAELETKLGDVRIKLKKIQTNDVNLEDDGNDDDDDDN